MEDTCIMPLAYLPPVSFYQIMLKHKKVIFDIHEHFHKQFYFNRCAIYGANGMLKLSVPIMKNHDRTPLKEKLISNDSNWRTIHWRSIEAAYRRSPFFEFYEDALRPVYMEYPDELPRNMPVKLMEWNLNLFETVNKLLNVEINYSLSESYQKTYKDIMDYRNLNSPKSSPVLHLNKISYQQVFMERNGFIANLSIIDLLFCEGAKAKQLLLE